MKRTPIKRARRKPRPGRLKGKDLAELRDACFLRDRGLCQRCGCMVNPNAPRQYAEAYHMAHIKAKRIGGDSLENVRVLCGSCHRQEHAYGKAMVKPVPRKEA